jgi:large subunit ribosomal protein L24
VAKRIRKGDLVQIITGADRGKQGHVIAIRSDGMIRVEKVRLQKRHLKPGRRDARAGGIIEQEGYINPSNAMLVDPSSNKPSRIRIREEDDRRIRVFAKSGEAVPEPARS